MRAAERDRITVWKAQAKINQDCATLAAVKYIPWLDIVVYLLLRVYVKESRRNILHDSLRI